MHIELLPPPEGYPPFVTTFFRLQCDERSIRDVQPSSIGIIAIMGRGSGQMRFLDGRVDPSHPLLVLTPLSAASTFEVDGPWDVFGATLSPLGWAGLTGLSAADHGNRLRPLGELVAEPLHATASAILEDYADLSNEEMIQRLAPAIAAAYEPVPEAHVAFLGTVNEWIASALSPSLSDLYGRLNYSKRQVQRLCERYFGLTPVRLARKYRALRAAVLLSRPSLTPQEIDAVQDQFYDQPHMIREIRMFAGRTPARIGDPDLPYLTGFLNLRDFSETGPRLAPIPDDLRG